MAKLLWQELNLTENFSCDQVDEAYSEIENKTPETTFAWKVLRDKYYSEVYKNYHDVELLIRAGFLLDPLTLEEIDYYNINLLTTPVNKILDNMKDAENPIVLLSTGGFYPLHDGHIKMMEETRKVLSDSGYDVIGGYFSLSHEEYISTKPFYIQDEYERVNACRESLKNSDWLMVDPWESLYVKAPINFTNVIERLEKYLKKHVNNNIRVAYVFGGDNVEFMYCFIKDGIAVCLNRNGHQITFEKTKAIKNDRMFFIDSNEEYSDLSSRNFRENIAKGSVSYKEAGSYLIRNEALLPLENYVTKNNIELIKEIQEKFLNKLMRLFSSCFDNEIFIKVINMEYQLKHAYNFLKDKKTINLDSYYRGTYNLEVSRLFDISSYQNKNNRLVGRLDNQSVSELVKDIEGGTYILVDDDSVTGRTINCVKENLPKDVEIESVYLLANSINEKIFDVVDLRDFIIGAKNSGLVVRLPNGEITRAPYIMPYVNLTTRASIPPGRERFFSIAIWQMNKEFFSRLNENLKLKDTNANFIKLMSFIDFNEETKLVDICDWHIDKLSNERFKTVEYNDMLKERIIEFLKDIAIGEFGFKKWKEYLENKSFEQYKKEGSKFFIVLNNDNQIIATIGGLKQSEGIIKLNSFYVRKEYRYHKIGTKLYEKLLRYAKENNYETMILCSYDKFDAATNFYQRRGFKIYKNDKFERWYRKELL